MKRKISACLCAFFCLYGCTTNESISDIDSSSSSNESSSMIGSEIPNQQSTDDVSDTDEYPISPDPHDIVLSTSDSHYTIARVVYGLDRQDFYIIDNHRNSAYGLGLYSSGIDISFVGQTIAVTENGGVTELFDLSNGNKQDLSFPKSENGRVVGVTYDEQTDCWIRAVAPYVYAQPEKERQARVLFEFFDNVGTLTHNVTTPFTLSYGKAVPDPIHIGFYDGKIVLLERNQDNWLEADIAFMDVQTGEFSRIEGGFFAVSGEYLFVVSFERDQRGYIENMTARQYLGTELLAETHVNLPGNEEMVSSLYYDVNNEILLANDGAIRFEFGK